MSTAKENINKGFTLVELLVTISIFVILTGVVLFGQSKFDSSILLTNLAYDTALTVRQAQNYGINVKEFNIDSVGRFVPYGVHFALDNPKSFILFADLSYNNSDDLGDGLYKITGGDDDTSIVLSRCQTEKGCVNRYNIKRGNYISKICINNEEESCPATSLDIVFKRPNPDALIQINGISPADITSATIFLSGTDGSSVRKVRVQSNGLIEIVPNNL